MHPAGSSNAAPHPEDAEQRRRQDRSTGTPPDGIKTPRRPTHLLEPLERQVVMPVAGRVLGHPLRGEGAAAMAPGQEDWQAPFERPIAALDAAVPPIPAPPPRDWTEQLADPGSPPTARRPARGARAIEAMGQGAEA